MNHFTNNRNKFAQYMEENSVAVVFAGQAPYKRGDEKYPFSPDRNFYYLTGIDRENCILFMSNTTKGFETKLYIPRDNGYLAKWVGANMTVEEAKEISGITDVSFVDLFQSDFAEFVFKYNIDTLWLDLENRDWNALPTAALSFAKEVQGKYPSLILDNSYPIFSDLRLIKDGWELERMHRAMKITEEGFLAMMSLVRPGMKEYEIEAYFDFVLTKRGVRQKAFQTIAASGERGCILHYTENNQTTKDGDLILVDAGAQVDWYNGDITRTFPVNGKFSDQQKLVYNIVLEGHRKVVETIQPGVPFARLNEVLREHYVEALTEIGLITEPEELNKYYYHGVSHYLGAETHDIGRYIDRELQAGMVLTVEPGLYIEEWNIGIRIEDDVLVTDEGSEILTIDMIRTVEEIESYMAKGRMK
ncbi:aminopeptidase P family protein [Chakrabartyella piscis]|uniref:aminopeptidase P family protein n=1 Tax=Chakrabartyella piscis TaxID=2918914 RepID=UPI0029589693|nr:aminopeptidase P family protein [Chakrabartyella piscis]